MALVAPMPRAESQVPAPVVIAGYQYIGGGSANVPFVASAGLHTAGVGAPVQWGVPITFTNLDPIAVIAPHSATSCNAPCDVAVPNGLFDTGELGLGGSSTVDTSALAPATYVYFCVVHGPSMRGSFAVV